MSLLSHLFTAIAPLIFIYLANLNFFLHQQIKPKTPVNWEILSKHV